MDTCEFHASCFYLNMIKKRPRAVKYLIEEFCDGNYHKCARYMLFKTHGPCKVPRYLLPEDMHKACKILNDPNN